MDPYLEDSSIWPDLHSTLISYIREELQPQVRPKYIARIGERVEVAGFGTQYVPDVMLVEPPMGAPFLPAVAGTLVADDPTFITMLDDELRIPFIEIIYRETGDLVTVIEVLSLDNKVGAGRERYLRKQKDILRSRVNLVEIDLLSIGQPSSLAHTNPEIEGPVSRYVVATSRSHIRRKVEFYAIGLRERLPRCRIPLRQEDTDAVLDLPKVFTRAYDMGAHDLLIDYSGPPPVPLSIEDGRWMVRLLAAMRRQGK